MSLDPNDTSDRVARAEVELVGCDRRTVELRVTGSVDPESAEELASTLQRHRRVGRRWVLLDLSAADFLSADGVETLLREHQRFRDCGGALTLTGTGLAASRPVTNSASEAPARRPAGGLSPQRHG